VGVVGDLVNCEQAVLAQVFTYVHMNVQECIGGCFMMPEQLCWIAGLALFAYFPSLSKVGNIYLHERPS
jgi:hypothetical protein